MKGPSAAAANSERTLCSDWIVPSSSTSADPGKRTAAPSTSPIQLTTAGGSSKKRTPGSAVGGGRERMGILRERRGVLYNSIPRMPLPLAVFCCLLNILLPGLGTFISAWTSLCGCHTRLGSPVQAVGLGLLAALGQMVSFVVIVGWVWSILWGMNFVHIANAGKV
ncbi:protein stum homolog [Babylonia areolata]|uniref:protein stum homolog n=1 Tax=Babylonia areolata TaxID=304850 RepID=UPI003FD54977